MPKRRPCFLYIMTDQHRADWLGVAGHPVVRTPHIDSLAAQGTRFTRFHVASPVCMPNRASFMTGRYPTTHGLRTNGCLLPQSATTFVDALRISGYNTASIGKSHLQPFTGNIPFGHRVIEAGPIDEAWHDDGYDYGQEEGTRYTSDQHYAFATPYYGFDHVDVVTEHGHLANGHYLQWLRTQTPDWEALRDPANQLPHQYRCPQAIRTAIPEELYSTSYIRNQACDWLRAQADSEEPFFVFVSFPDPHHPFTPPGRYWDMFDPEEFTVGVSHEAHTDPPPPLTKTVAATLAGEGPVTPQTAFALLEPRQIKEAMALSAGMLAMVDDAVGDLLGALQDSGRFDETVICFNADHGEYMGDSSLMLKGAWSRDSIDRVPFIWSDPEDRSPHTSDALAATIDLAPTILERAGVGPYYGIQGQSLLGNMAGSRELRESLLIEFNDALPRMGFDQAARVRTLITDQHRMSVYQDHEWGELYDRTSDAHDTHNLWADPAHASVRGELALRLNQHLIKLMDESPTAKRLA